MRREIVICDFCKKEIKTIYTLTMNTFSRKKYDLCKKCTEKIIDIIEEGK